MIICPRRRVAAPASTSLCGGIGSCVMEKAPSGASCEMRTRIASNGLVKLGLHVSESRKRKQYRRQTGDQYGKANRAL